MYRLPARTKPISHILRREIRRSSFLSVRNVSSSFIPNDLAASNLRATPRIQPFASVLISKLCTSTSGNFSGAISKTAADIFDEKILKLEPYHTALRNCVYTGNIGKMENIIVEMRTKGLSPTEETYDYLVAAHVRNKDFSSALQTINGLKELGISHTTKIIVTLMRAYSENGDFDGAKKAYDDTISAGAVSDLILLKELLRAHSVAGRPDLAEELVLRMEEMSIVPDREAMHLLIKSYANNGDLKGVQDTLKVFYVKALKPTIAIMNTVLESIVNSPQVDDWDAFMQSYSSLFPANKLQPDHNTYSLLLQACLRDKRVKDAVLIVDEIIDLDIKISREARETFRLVVGDEIFEEVANKLKTTYIPKPLDKVRTATTIDKTLNFKKMWGVEPRKESAYSNLRKNPNKDEILASKRHVGDYHTIIRDYAKDGDVASVKNIMDEMVSKNYRCDVEMMNTLLIAHSKNNDSLGAQEVVNDMKRKGMRITLSTYRILISAYSAVGDPDGALRVLQSAVGAGFRPDIYFLGEILRAYGIVGNIEQAEMTLSALHDLEFQPNKKNMHFALTAYAKNGDMRGVDDVIARMGSMGLTPTSTTINIVLRSILNNDVMDWDAFTSCYFEHFGFQKFVADIDTYAVLLDACEKYDRPLDAAKWFRQMLAVDAYPTPPIRDTLHRILGDEDFEVFRSGLAPQYQYAMSIIDRKAELFPGRHSTASEESARLQRLGAISPKIDISKSSSTPRADSHDVAVKGVSADASHGHGGSNVEQVVTAPKRSRSPRVSAQGVEVTSVTSANVSVLLPSMSSLLVLGDRGDLQALEAMIEKLKVEGSVPLSLLMESLVYAHMKAFNTTAAQRVVDDMKFDNIDVSRQTFDYLMQAYSDDGNGPGTEMVASHALSMGFALDASFLNKILRAYSKSSDPVGAEKAIRAVSASSSDADKTLIDRKSVNYLLMAYANCGDVDGAFHVLSRFKNKGFSPDTVTINTLLQSIDTASAATHDEKLDAFSSYLWGKDLIADHITFKRAMSIFARYGDESKGVRWLDGLLDNGISADDLLLEKLRPLLSDKRIEVHRGRNTSDQRSASVNADRSSILKSSPLPLHVSLPSASPSLAPSISRAEGSTADALKVQTPTSSNPSPHKPSFVFVAGLVSGKQPDAVINGSLYTEYHSNFIALLDKYSSVGDAKSIKGILDMMKTCNMPLGMIHYNHLLRSHAVRKNVVEARRVVNGCNKVGLQLDMDSRHHLCDVYVNSSDAVRAEQVLLDVQQSGSQPDLYLLERIMQLHADAGNAAGVEKALSSFSITGQVPHEMTMKYLLKAHAIKGDTEGFNTVMAEYAEAKLPTSTPILNSALRLTLNAPGELDWEMFLCKYTELFPEDMLVENAETYEILFAACGKYEKADQATEWYNDLITMKQEIVTTSNRDAFRNAVGDKIYREHYKQLLNHIRKFVLDLDSRPTSFIPSERLLTRMTRVKNDSVVSTLMKKEAVRVELAVQELAAAGFLESCEAVSESSDWTVLNKIIANAGREESLIVLSLMEDLRRRPSGRAKIPVLNTFAKAGDIENTKRIVAMYTAQGHTPDAEVRNIILSAYINHPGESMWEEIKKFYENNYGQKNCKADYHTFRFLLRACEKYRNRDAAFAWYEEALNLHVSTAGLKSILRHTVGANEFEKYCNRQSPESLEGSESPVSEGMILDNKDPLTSTDTPDTTLISSAGLLEMAASAIQVLREVKVKVVSETIYVEARASAPTFIESIQGNNREEARAEAAFQQFASMLPRSVSAPVPVPAPVSAPVQPVRREIPEVCEAATDHEESLEESVGESFDESYDESDSTDSLEKSMEVFGFRGDPGKAEQALVELDKIGRKPREYTMECLIHAHSFHGDVEGTLKALARYKELGYTPTRVVHNNVLSAYLNSPGFNCWQDIVNYFETSYGDFQSEADLATYQILLAACHKYQRRSEAIYRFNEALARGRLDVSRLKKPLLHVIGSREYGHYRAQLCPEDRSTFDVERAPEKYTRPTPRRRREVKAAALAAAALAEEEMAAVTLSNSSSSSSIPYSAPTTGSEAVTESTSIHMATVASLTSTSSSTKESHRLDDTEPLSLSMPMAWHTIN